MTADPFAGDLEPLTDLEFARLGELIHAEAGILLSPAKKALVTARLSRRVRALGLTGFGPYLECVRRHPGERATMLECMCTHETRFFREPQQFELLESSVLPRWRAAGDAGARRKQVRAWSAGCATGEEPFSLAMLLLDAFPPGLGWSVEVLATDLSAAVLERARAATWPVERSADIPPRLARAWMLRGVRGQAGLMRASDELRRHVRFLPLNLHGRSGAGDYGPLGTFDLIFCRNVLIYFGPEAKAAVLRRLLAHLAPEGLLHLGHAETLHGTLLRDVTGGACALRGVAPSVYARQDASRPREQATRDQATRGPSAAPLGATR